MRKTLPTLKEKQRPKKLQQPEAPKPWKDPRQLMLPLHLPELPGPN